MDHAIGIHLGTGYGVVAVSRRNNVDVIANDTTGSRTTPCLVGFIGGEPFVGDAAKDLPASQTVFDVKRLLGCQLNDPDVKSRCGGWPFKVLASGGSLAIQVEGLTKTLSPEEVTSFLLADLKNTAKSFLSRVKKAVITVPVHFTERQRRALEESARLAGLEVLELLPEPLAAVLSYKLDRKNLGAVLVLHMGAGTCEASVVRIKDRKTTVLASRADLHLGGRDLDDELVEHLLPDIRTQCGVEVSAADTQCMNEIREACKNARLKLSRAATTSIELRVPGGQPPSYHTTMTRQRLEAMCAGLLQKVTDLCAAVLEEAKVAQPDEVVLVGGMTRMPRLRSLLKQMLGGKELLASLIPEEALAQGAALHAAALSGGGTTFREVDLRDDESSPQRSSAAVITSRTEKEKEKERKTETLEAPPIGIDLGTTFSVVAVHRKGRTAVLCDEGGSRTIPSVVGFRDNQRYVGVATEGLPVNSKVFDSKRLIGRSFRDPVVQADMKRWPFVIVDQLGAPRFQLELNGKQERFSPEEISSMILSSLKDIAESYLELPVKKAVITVPAYFDETQRQATKDAGVIAGLEVLAMINEPTAACLAYGLANKSSTQETVVLVYDLGGGTFDVSVMRIRGNEFQVLASGGDTHLGGQDFNMRLMEHFIQDIAVKHPSVQIAGDAQALQDLRSVCELLKRKLSTVAESSAYVAFHRQKLQYKASVSRALFENLCADLFQKTIDITQRVLVDAKVDRAAVHDVVLVGGSTRVPKVRSLLESFFGGRPLKHSINPDEAVAYGAAVHAAALGGDRVVANQVVLRDVTPLSLGVATLGDVFNVIVPRNSQIPYRATKNFQPAVDYQVEVVVEVFQGERQFASDNHFLKYFHINVPRKPWSEVTIQVTFVIDENGLLTVSGRELSTGLTQQVSITQNEARLNNEEVQKMIKNALRFKDQDQHKKERIEDMLRNNVML